ncbi:MAG: sigma-70 family RNA polymerase sigma factor [Ruminococcus sp.]|nr:sigma-70 family RNA polymerase sigma factor [Ruminococcus sp.]
MNECEMAEIYDKFSGAVYRIAFMYCKNTADAEDITQETFIKRFTADVEFPDEKSEKTWLLRVAANKCKDLFRSARYRFLRSAVPIEEAGLVYEDPEESQVFHAVMELPPKYRLVVHLFYYEGYSAAEIGKMTGCSETAVQTRLYRARKMLKKSLGEELEL